MARRARDLGVGHPYSSHAGEHAHIFDSAVYYTLFPVAPFDI